ncbi:MAG: DNA repair protein RecN [Candidatus Brocadiales bacterium]
MADPYWLFPFIMLYELHISNLALIDDVTIGFGDGLNVISGATGAGKSLIITALDFILGGRATTEIIKNGAAETTVSGLFQINNDVIAKEIDKKCGVSSTSFKDRSIGSEILLQRTLDTAGRSRCRINATPITVTMFREIGETLVNIHGQHEHESLLQTANQLLLLDEFAGMSELRGQFSELYQKMTEKRKRSEVLKTAQETQRQQIELFKFQIDEIDKAELKPGELEELERERKILMNAEKIHNIVSASYNALYESEDSILQRLKVVIKDIQSAASLDDNINKTQESCSQSLYHIEEAVFELSHYIDSFDFNPQRLEQIECRLHSIQRLKTKYGSTVEDILSYRSELEQKLSELATASNELDNVDNELQSLLSKLKDIGRKLNKERSLAAIRLAKLVETELSELGMEHGKFSIHFAPPNFQEDGMTSYGYDKIEFLISPNPGEEMKPLRKIASGGEISRVMLALKHRVAQADRTPVLVFDEIDANVGSRMGKIIGEKLYDIARARQVICITHLPQIASYANHQLKVQKIVRNGRTHTIVEKVSGSARLEEIAEMIHGTGKTEITRKQAKEMLKDASKRGKK